MNPDDEPTDDDYFDAIDADDLDAARALAQQHPKSVPPELHDFFDEDGL